MSRRILANLWLVGGLVACAGSTPSTEGTSSPSSFPGSTVTSAVTPSTTAVLAPSSSVPPSVVVDPLEACVESWPLTDRVALMVWPSVYGNDWRSARQVVGELGVGGVVLMKPSKNFAAGLAGHISELDELSRHGVLVSTDEEGGAVQRLSALGVLPSQEEMSNLSSEQRVETLRAHAAVVAQAGVDIALAPVVDVRPSDGSDPLGQGRLFVGDASQVASMAADYVAAWLSVGVLPVLKHFPGHGSASTDTHLGLASTPPLEELMVRDLVPYVRLASSGAAVMVGHLDVPDLTAGEPASLSAPAYRLLREELGWGDTLVMTDALGMGGAGSSLTDAAVAAVVAGADVVLFTETGRTADVIDALVGAVGSGVVPVDRINSGAIRVARQLELEGVPCRPAG